ncbi:MAG TPA: ATP-binding protein [Syntrophales bacterium]|nr:ATP-binding protein [Syntrophales bacterium]
MKGYIVKPPDLQPKTVPGAPPAVEEKLAKRIRWLIVWRLFIVTSLLGFVALIDVRDAALLPDISRTSLYAIIILTYLLTIGFILLLKLTRAPILNVYIQSMADVLLITALVYITGGIRSVHAAFYPLVIIYSVLFLMRRGGLITASVCSVLYGLLLISEHLGLVAPLYSTAYVGQSFTAGYVLTRILIYSASFFIIVFLASFVVEQERKAQTLLAETESAFNQLDILHQSIIDSVDAGILTMDVNGLVKSFNRGAERITGFLAREVVNRPVGQIFPDFVDILARPADADSGISERRPQFSFRSKGGQSLLIGCSVSTLNDPGGQRIGDILIFQDLTEVRAMQRAVEENKRLALVGEMAAGLAHEIRNPLASITGSIQVLKRDLALKDEDEKLMQIILRGKEQLEGFLKDFLLLSRAPAAKRDRIALDVLIRDVVESVRFLPDWHDRIRLSLKVAPDDALMASATEIRQVIWNLILNAVQAMPEGGDLRIEIVRHPRAGGDRGRLEVIVADEGEGIEEHLHDRIFTPFYTTKERGTGLGLAIVQRVVTGHGGRIEVKSRPRQGTAFHVYLPCGDLGRD